MTNTALYWCSFTSQ